MIERASKHVDRRKRLAIYAVLALPVVLALLAALYTGWHRKGPQGIPAVYLEEEPLAGIAWSLRLRPSVDTDRGASVSTRFHDAQGKDEGMYALVRYRLGGFLMEETVSWYCLRIDPHDGEVLWRQGLPPTYPPYFVPTEGGLPLVLVSHPYLAPFYDRDPLTIHGRDPATGRSLWELTFKDYWCQSVTAAGRLLFASVGLASKDVKRVGLLCVDLSSGTERWTQWRPDQQGGSEAKGLRLLAATEHAVCVFAQAARLIVTYSAQSGNLLWQAPAGETLAVVLVEGGAAQILGQNAVLGYDRASNRD